MVNIENYGDMLLYFCEVGNMKEIFDFGLYGRQRVIIVDKYDPHNVFKLDKYDSDQWVINLTNMEHVNGL